mgnify:FL=1
MIINCICGKKKFKLADELMPSEGSKVRCGACSEVWFYHPEQGNLNESVQSSDNLNYQDQNIGTELDDSENSTIVNETAEHPLTEKEEKISNFKIFTDEDSDLPSKEEMDKNLDNFKRDRDQNLNFFQKLLKKDRIQSAADALEKKELEQISDDEQEINQGRRTRLLFYLLILLMIVFSIVIVPLKEDVAMAFPFMESYLDFLSPIYEYIRVPLGLR